MNCHAGGRVSSDLKTTAALPGRADVIDGRKTARPVFFTPWVDFLIKIA
jgi:hypothetical protein